jgi:hypothetical protein
VNKEFTEPFKRLLESLETTARYIVQSDEVSDRDKAIQVKAVLARPLGILNAKHKLASNSRNQRKTVDK